MIVFKNPGLIDLRLIKSFGTSVKEAEDARGVFGTGSKYALAILLRTQHKVELYRGVDRFVFGLKKVEIRNKEFDFVTLIHPDGTEEELPFNSRVGLNWEVWEAFRELHSNALDEGGTTFQRLAHKYDPNPNETAFVIHGEGIDKAFAERHSIFLSGDPIYKAENFEVYPGESDFIYMRGVRVKKLERRSKYTYNFFSFPGGLTEDRTLKNSAEADFSVARSIAACTDKSIIEQVIVVPRSYYEASLWGYSMSPSKEFMEAYQELSRQRLGDLTEYATTVYKTHESKLPLPDPVKLTSIQEKQLKRAVEFCRKLGWSVDDYPIIVVPHARKGLLALADAGRIVLTTALFDAGTKTVASALYEEYLHLKYNFLDESRELQTYLFNQVIGLGEQLLNEPI